MTSDSQRKLARDERDHHIGCMWVLISMFDFRNSGSTQKLISDRKRGSKRISGGIDLRNKLDRLRSPDECHELLNGGAANVASENDKPSVKKLIDEEMHSEQKTKEAIRNDKEEKISDLNARRPKTKTGKREKKTCSNLDQQPVSSSNQSGEMNLQLNQTDERYKERMRELIRLLMDQKEDETRFRNDVLRVSQILRSGDKSFLKLIDQLENLVPEDVEVLQNSQTAKEGNLKSSSFVSSVLSEQGVRSAAQSDQHCGTHREHSFFLRKTKSQEKIENFNSHASNEIVILKPGPMISDAGSSSATRSVPQKERRYKKPGLRFLITGLKGKLKSTTRKEKNGIKEINEIVGRDCSGKNLVFTEATTRASSSRDSEAETPRNEKEKQNVSIIYMEAKRHLCEMLRNGEIDANLSSERVPSILGRILALPEYLSPVGSPQRIQEHSFVGIHEISQECNLIPLGQTTVQAMTWKCDSDFGFDNTVELLESNPGSNDQAEDTNSGDGSETVKEAEVLEHEDGTELHTFGEPCTFNNETDPNDDEDKELHDENGDLEITIQIQETWDETMSPASPRRSSSNSLDCQENATDAPGKSSPNSVLEPLFTEDDNSPTTSRSCSVEIRLQPLRIKFEEPNISETDEDIDIKTTTDDKETTFEYIKAVVQASNLNLEELYMKSLTLDQLLESSLIDEVDFFQTQLCSDKNILFDCINEVLTEFCGHESGCCASLQNTLNMEEVVHKVQREVYWHLVPVPSPHTLDQIVRKDLGKRGRSRWMDLRYEAGCIGAETGETILDELLEEILVVCVNRCPDPEIWELGLNKTGRT